jgi:signal transduction histidine kinase
MLLLTIELESLDGAHAGGAPAAAALTVARDIAKSLHELSHQLHPTRLRVIGLTGALERLSLELSRTGFAISFTHERVPATLPPDVTLCLFRVVQEGLQNSIKYSNAGTVSVHLRGGPAGLTLTIADDGVGFDVIAAMGRGVGLVSMVERVEAAGGSLDIRSAPGAGTRVTATMPAPLLQSAESIPLANVAAS